MSQRHWYRRVVKVLFGVATMLAACGDTLVDHRAPAALLELEASCQEGLQSCGTGCFPDSDLICDRATCEVCRAPAQAEPRCEDTRCTFVCVGGTRQCGDRCVAESVVACGSSCALCPEPENGLGDAVCVPGAALGAGQCDITCDLGFHLCGSSCLEETAQSCGTACVDCSGSIPAHATAVCSAVHTCDFACNPGFLRCDTGCCGVTQVATGADFTCAVSNEGGLFCWGRNDMGQLGEGSTTAQPNPVMVFPSGAQVTRVSAGATHACAIAAGALYCWGNNASGQLGMDSTAAGLEPALVALPGVTEVAVGGYLEAVASPVPHGHTCAVTAAHAVYCWGDNARGQLGLGDLGSRTVPTLVSGLSAATGADAIALGARHSCVRTASGGVACWGERTVGQVGDGMASVQPALAPVTVRLSGVGALAVGERHGCLTDISGGDPELLCFGSDAEGQIGADGPSYVTSPTAPSVGGGLSSARPNLVAAGRAHTCLLRLGDIGGLKCLGANNQGQLALPASGELGAVSDVALPATNLPQAIAAGGDHSCALLADGELYCWGDNRHGQLGDGTTTSRFDPAPIVSP